MDWRPLVEGYIANFGISLDIFEFFHFRLFFWFFKKFGFLGILVPPYCGIGATIRIGREGTIGCHPMLTENANFVTNALKGHLSTVDVWPRCGHHTCSVHQWIVNWILPQFDPRKSSQALLEAEIPSPLYIILYVWLWWKWWWLGWSHFQIISPLGQCFL